VKVLCEMCLLSLIYSYVIWMWVTVFYVVVLFCIPVSLFRIPKLLALDLFVMYKNTHFMLLFVL
jgi:hypothetical protein